jgi:hypothetical protein
VTKFVQVLPLKRGLYGEPPAGFTLTYISEVPVAVGDIVAANVYNREQYHRVEAVGATREKVGSTYNGAIKVINRVLTDKERKAFERVTRAEAALERAYDALNKASDAASKEA